MIKNYLRILLCGFALSCNALPALANFDITVGSGTHIFSIDSGTTPAGTGNCAASATECTASIPIDKSGTPLFATGNAGLVTGTGGIFPATQSGTWTVQPGNTANTTPWLATINQGGNSATVSAGGALKVDGSAATQPVSGTVTAAQATASSLNATVVGTGTFATQATQSGNWTARVVGNAGGVVDFTGQAATAPANALLAGATFFTTPTTLSNGQASPLQVDNAGNLLVNVKAGGASGGTSSNFGSAFPIPGTAVGMSQGGNMVALTGTSNNLNVQCANCSGSGVSTADEAAFSAGSSLFAGGGGFFQTTATSNALTNGQQGMFQLTANRAIFSNLRNAAGTEVGTAGAPLQVSVANTAANGTAMLVTGTGGTFPIATWGGGTLGAMANYGTSPGAVLVPGVNAFITNTNANGQAVAASSSPVVLPVLQTFGGAIAAAVPANGDYISGNAVSAEPTAATTGNLTGVMLDLAGKVITSPYANRENMVRGSITGTDTSAHTIIAAQGSNVKTYITDIECGRSDAGTAAITLTLSDANATILVLPNNGGGGGNSKTFNVPIVTASNTAFSFTSGTSTSTVYCSAQGFKGY